MKEKILLDSQLNIDDNKIKSEGKYFVLGYLGFICGAIALSLFITKHT